MAPKLKRDEELAELYHWVDTIPLSRPKKNISRDFSDGGNIDTAVSLSFRKTPLDSLHCSIKTSDTINRFTEADREGVPCVAEHLLAVLMAEVVSYCTPKLVELHNYSAANAVERKAYNWNTLNQKVFRRLGMRLESQEIEDIVNARPGAVEKVLALYRQEASDYSARMTEKDAAFSDAISGLDATDSTPGGGSVPTPLAGPVYFDTYQSIGLLKEKEETIAELQETNVIMKEKIKQLEQLLNLKDERIAMLTQELTRYEVK